MTFREVLTKAIKDLSNSSELLQFSDDQIMYGETDRYRCLDRYESFFTGCQYQNRKANWDGRQVAGSDKSMLVQHGVTESVLYPNVPHYLRKPYIQKQLTASIIHRLTGLLFGDKQTPHLCSRDEEGQAYVDELIKQSQWWSNWALARDYGGAVGSVAVGVGVLDGHPVVEVANGKHCTPIFKYSCPNKSILTALRIAFKRPKTVIEYHTDVYGRNIPEVKETLEFYCRIITENQDIQMTSLDGKSWNLLGEPIQNNLGFCPWVWIRNTPVLNEADGLPDCDGQWDNLETIDYILSQGSAGVRINCDPTLVIKTGEDPKTVRTGSMATIILSADPNRQEDAKLLESSGSGGASALAFAGALRDSILEDVRCVLDEGQATGRSATEMIKRTESMYEHVDDLRRSYGNPLERSIEMLISICKNAELDECFDELTAPKTDDCDCDWAAMVQMSTQEQQLLLQTYVQAIGAGLISHETARARLAATLGVTDLKAEVELIESETKSGLYIETSEKPADELAEGTHDETGEVETQEPEEGQPEESSTNKDAVAQPDPLTDATASFPRLSAYKKVGKATAYFVDGNAIRNSHPDVFNMRTVKYGQKPEKWNSTDYTEGGNWAIYPWIPKNEIWIDVANKAEADPIMAHELVEAMKMIKDGWDYDKAHDYGTKIEDAVRNGEEDFDVLIKETLDSLGL